MRTFDLLLWIVYCLVAFRFGNISHYFCGMYRRKTFLMIYLKMCCWLLFSVHFILFVPVRLWGSFPMKFASILPFFPSYEFIIPRKFSRLSTFIDFFFSLHIPIFLSVRFDFRMKNTYTHRDLRWLFALELTSIGEIFFFFVNIEHSGLNVDVVWQSKITFE